jgi:AcrR family transcriptional regulator
VEQDLSEPKEAIDREAQIIATAATLFATKGFEATSIRDIAEGVGISKPTIYHYFADKNALYIRIIVTGAKNLCLFTEARISVKSAPREQLLAFLEGHAGYFEENQVAYLAANFGFAGLRDQLGRRQTIQWRDRHEANLRRIIEDGIRSGDFAMVRPQVASLAILSSLQGLARWYRSDGALKPIEIAHELSALFLNGVLARR